MKKTTVKVTCEFKINFLNSWRAWDSISAQSETFASWEHAVNYAKQRAHEFTAEVRVNKKDSLQGHYFRADEHRDMLKTPQLEMH